MYKIAVDGPAGAGKSTISKMVAKEIGFIYVDTGAFFRTIALGCIKGNVDISNEEAVNEAINMFDISFAYENGEQQVYLNKENVSSLIRTAEVSNAASVVSAYKAVRQKVNVSEYEISEKENVVMDGRDIGTSVFPDASVKIYLTASSYVRAVRRLRDYEKKGIKASIEEVEKEIIERDERDMHREISPLTRAEDAVFLDSSDLTVDEVVSKMVTIIKSKIEL